MRLPLAVRLVTILSLVWGGLAVVTAAPASAAALTATLVASHSTSTWARPSPDPSGITYDATRNELIIADGEVDEMPLYAGTNLFVSSLTGVQSAAFPGGTTVPWSHEPTGIGYRPSNGRVYTSDDDMDRIFEVVAGADGRYGTPDDQVTSFSTRPQSGDAEDVSMDMDVSNNGHLLVIDGVNKDILDYGPGPNGRFDGIAPTGDDTLVVIDVGQYGAQDPEGIEYYPGRNTILVLDDTTATIYELNRQGGLLNTVSIAAASPRKAAGITLAPASNGSGAQNLYIVDRGVDNDSNPSENDGRFYEMAVSLPPVPGGANTAPVVSAGADQTVTLPSAATLSGNIIDDGLPNPPGTVTATWSMVSGPGTVTFTNAAAPATTATFDAAGSYVLRLTGNDGSLQTSDDVSVVVGDADPGGGGSGVLDVPVRVGTDDAEERSASTSVTGGDLDIVVDGATVQTVGLRFTGVTVPRGATITSAYVQFEVDEVSTGAANLTIVGQAADNPPGFTTAAGNISARPRTTAQVGWVPPAWPTTRARGPDQRTSNLAPVVQEILSRTGWVAGNALVLVVTGSGTRLAEAFEGGAARAPVLHLEYGSGSGPGNVAPVVSAGPDRAVRLPAAATLTGSVTDDGLPNPPAAVTAAWSTVSGPGTVTFADASAASTTATFGAIGNYVLRLTGSDGTLSAADDVSVTVSGSGPAPTVLEVPVRGSVDDAEERASTGVVSLTSGDVNLGQDGAAMQTVALRFTGITVPAGATITGAWIQFQVDEVSTAAAQLTLEGQAADDAAAFSTTARDVSTRPRTAAEVVWTPASWPTVGARTADQRTPDLAVVLQEIVDRPLWTGGNAVVLLVTGTGTRVAESFDGGAVRAPVLRVEYTG